jgi:hypothetical protein
MTRDERLKLLTEALARKNQLDPPAVSPVDFEVRTMIKMPDMRKERLVTLNSVDLKTPPVLILWSYDIDEEDNDFSDFAKALADLETTLVPDTTPDVPRYIATYFKFASEVDASLNFTTAFACNTMEEIGSVGRYPPGSEAKKAFETFTSFVAGFTLRQTILCRAAGAL